METMSGDFVEVLTSMLKKLEKKLEREGPQKNLQQPEDKEDNPKLENNDGDSLNASSNSTGSGKSRKRRPGTVQFCSYCPKKFQNLSSLRNHEVFHKEERPFVCLERGCVKAYKTKSELNRHSQLHSNTREFACIVCNKRFMRKQYLKNHVRTHPEPNPQIIRCKWTGCSKIFVVQADADCHILTYHLRRDRSKSAEDIDNIIGAGNREI